MRLYLSCILFCLTVCTLTTDVLLAQTTKQKEDIQVQTTKTKEIISTQTAKTEEIITRSTNTHLLTSKGVDEFLLGEPIPFDLPQYEFEQSSRRIEEFDEPIYNVYQDGELLLVIQPVYDRDRRQFTDKIGDIIVWSERYYTDTGIRVGTTLREYRAKYPDAEMRYSYISRRFWIGGRMQFVFDPEGYTGRRDALSSSSSVTIIPAWFNPQSKIISIRIY